MRDNLLGIRFSVVALLVFLAALIIGAVLNVLVLSTSIAVIIVITMLLFMRYHYHHIEHVEKTCIYEEKYHTEPSKHVKAMTFHKPTSAIKRSAKKKRKPAKKKKKPARKKK